MNVRSRSLHEALRSLESLARGAITGVRPDHAELATILDTLHGHAPSAQVTKLISVLRSSQVQLESPDDRRRFFHATRALATGIRAHAA